MPTVNANAGLEILYGMFGSWLATTSNLNISWIIGLFLRPDLVLLFRVTTQLVILIYVLPLPECRSITIPIIFIGVIFIVPVRYLMLSINVPSQRWVCIPNVMSCVRVHNGGLSSLSLFKIVEAGRTVQLLFLTLLTQLVLLSIPHTPHSLALTLLLTIALLIIVLIHHLNLLIPNHILKCIRCNWFSPRLLLHVYCHIFLS